MNDELEAPILNSAKTMVCLNETVELTASVQDDAEAIFEWYTQQDNEDLSLLTTTSHPSYLLGAITPEKVGNYLVRIKKGDCISGLSNTISIGIIDTITTIESANTGPICQGGKVQLSATNNILFS